MIKEVVQGIIPPSFPSAVKPTHIAQLFSFFPVAHLNIYRSKHRMIGKGSRMRAHYAHTSS